MIAPVSLTDARGRINERAHPVAPTEMDAAGAAGLVLAEPIRSDTDHPPLDLSAMDGYAVRAADLAAGRALPIAFEIPAGNVPAALPPGCAARIFTGAALPPGADTVVPQEQATVATGGVTLEPLDRGENVRSRAQLFKAGDTVLPAGARLTPPALALAVMAGARTVRATPRPALAIVATGTELAPSGRALEPGQIRNSNSPMLRAFAAEAHLDVVEERHVRDELDALIDAFRALARRASIVVCTGGVSVGDYDLVPRALAALGGEAVFHGVAIRPGKPTLVARIADTWLVGLPGNPVAALVGWRLFVRPLAERLAGDPDPFAEIPIPVRAGALVENTSGRLVLHPCRLERDAGGAVMATPTGFVGSHDVHGIARANGLLVVEPRSSLAAGAPATGYPLPWAWPVR